MMEENIFGHAAEYWEDQRSSGLTIERGEQDQSKKELDLKNYIYFGRTCLIQTKASWNEFFAAMHSLVSSWHYFWPIQVISNL